MEKPIRIKRERIKDWRMPENTIYVGRPSKWGNPFTGDDAVVDYKECLLNNTMTYYYYNDKEEAFKQYERFRWICENISQLKGKNLACWCGLDKECHIDVLLEFVNN